MIDFSKITQTLDGYDCHYFGTREYAGTTLHCFGIMHPHFGVRESLYNAEGQRLTLAGGQWFAVINDDFQIVKPKKKKKIEVTGWVTAAKGEVSGQYYLHVHDNKEDLPQGCLEPQQHTFTFEVDE